MPRLRLMRLRGLNRLTGYISPHSGNKKPAGSGFFVYFSLVSLYSTCLRALGSNFMIDIFSGMVFLFLVVV